MLDRGGAIDLETVLNSMADGVVLMDHGNVVRFFNPAAEAIWGLSSAQVLGQNVSVLVPTNLKEHHDVLVDRHRRESIARIVGTAVTVNVQRPDGSIRWVSLTISAQDTLEGRWYSATARDITDEYERRIFLERLVEDSIYAVVSICEENRICWFNRSAERLFRRTAHDVVGENVKILVPLMIRREHDAMIAAHRVTGRDKIVGSAREVTIELPDGSTLPVTLAISKLPGTKGMRYVAFLRDISDEVVARDSARELLELRERVHAIMAHELRTPLAIADGHVKRALRKIGAGDAEAAARAMEKVGIATRRMHALMEDALLASQSGESFLQPVLSDYDPRRLAEEVVDLRREIAVDRDVRLTVAENVPSSATGDSQLMFSAFDNLLSNAVKYSGADQPVRLTLGFLPDPSGGLLMLEVTDRGVGIPEHELERIFERFYRASTASIAHGTGVGLDLVREVFRLHGGRVDVRSTLGEGSVFTATWLNHAQRPAARAASALGEGRVRRSG